jgi:membrane protease YdiL (CAAX protease family)
MRRAFRRDARAGGGGAVTGGAPPATALPPRPGAWLRRHPLAGYFGLCFGLSWGGILAILAATRLDLSALQPLEGGLLFGCMLLGPSVSGLIMTGAAEGHGGLRRLGARLLSGCAGAHRTAVALLTAPLLLLSILGLLSLTVDPAFTPRFQWPLFGLGFLAGLCEEIGWTGFATPRLLARRGVAAAGLSLGLVWAAWHLLVDFRYNAGAFGPAWLLEFAIVYVATLTPYRMLMTWLFHRTRSLSLAVLMHASFTGWLLVLFPTTSVTQALLWQSGFAALLWLAVALVLRRPASSGRRLASPLGGAANT